MSKFTNEEMEIVSAVVDMLSSKVNGGYKRAIENDTLPYEFKSNKEMNELFIKAVNTFDIIAKKLEDNNPGDLSLDEWDSLGLLCTQFIFDCKSKGGFLLSLGESVGYALINIFDKKRKEILDNSSNTSNHDSYNNAIYANNEDEKVMIKDMFNIIEGNDVEPFLEQNSQYDYANSYYSGKRKMLENRINELTSDEKKVLYESTKYTIYYLEKCVIDGVKSMQFDRNKLNGYYNRFIKQFKQDTKSEGCYIATAIYGDYNSPEVITLRRFRDQYLLERSWGKCFVSFYYKYSPAVVKKMKNKATLNLIIKYALDYFVIKIKNL